MHGRQQSLNVDTVLACFDTQRSKMRDDERFRAALVKWQRKCGTSLSAVKRVASDACETSWTNSAMQAVICSCRVHISDISVQHCLKSLCKRTLNDGSVR